MAPADRGCTAPLGEGCGRATLQRGGDLRLRIMTVAAAAWVEYVDVHVDTLGARTRTPQSVSGNDISAQNFCHDYVNTISTPGVNPRLDGDNRIFLSCGAAAYCK